MTQPSNHATTHLEERVTTLLQQMTLDEKIGQMTQVEKDSITPENVTRYHIGSVISGGGGAPSVNTVLAWREMVQSFMRASQQTRLQIPLIYGVDAVHGHANVHGATVFPHNVGLGATRNAKLVERIAQATASDLLATNIHWNFAPAVSVPRDIRWGRTYEGYSENTALVSELGTAYVRGLQTPFPTGDHVLGSVKHFVGDGGTVWGSAVTLGAIENWQAAQTHWMIDRGDTRLDEATLRRDHLAPYIDAIQAGADNIMVSFSSWNGKRMHAHHHLLTQILKGELGFEGFLVSDWMALVYLSPDPYQAVVTAINAGIDMVMIPYDYQAFITNLKQAVTHGDVAQTRIDDAAARILRAKIRLGLFEKPFTDDGYLADVGSADHRALASDAVQQSLVLLKNERATLPMSATQTVAVAGIAADDIGLACGGWTISWQGSSGATTDGATLLDGLRQHCQSVHYHPDGDFAERMETAIVVIAEKPTAEGEGDREDLTLSVDHTALIEKVRAQCERLILVMYSGRPLIITHVLDHCDAVVAAWLPGSQADAIAPVLLGHVPFTGRLPYTWIRSMAQVPYTNLHHSDEAPLWEYGFGLSL